MYKPALTGDPRQTTADVAKIRSHLGWQPKTCRDEGLARQWAWQAGLDAEPYRHSDGQTTPAMNGNRLPVLT